MAASIARKAFTVMTSLLLAVNMTLSPVAAVAAEAQRYSVVSTELGSGSGDVTRGDTSARAEKEFDGPLDTGYRLVARGADVAAVGGEVLSEDDDCALVGFPDVDSRNAALASLRGKSEFAVADTAFAAAEGESAPMGEATVDDAGAFAPAPVAPGPYDVAVIDTATSEGVADAIVSVLGEGATHQTTHGDAMVAHVRELDPDARVLSIEALDGAGSGSTASVYAAMMVAIDSGARIINLSMSARAVGGNAAIADAVARAWAAGVIVVGAAGNDGAPASWYVPGGVDAAVVAGSCDEAGEILASSNRGPTVDALVPSGTTSEAAARMSGWLSANSSFATHQDDIAAAIQAGVFFGSLAGSQDDTDSEGEAEGDGAFKAAAWTNETDLKGGVYFIKAKANSDYAVTADAVGTGSNVSMKKYAAGNRLQQWFIWHSGSWSGYSANVHMISPADHANRALGRTGGATAPGNGKNIQIVAADAQGPGKVFYVDKNGTTYSFHDLVNSDKTIDVQGGNYNGGNVQLWDRERTSSAANSYGSKTASQQFTLTRAFYNVKYNGNGATSGSMDNTKVWMHGALSADDQAFPRTNAFKREYTVTYNYNGSGASNTTAKATSTFNGWAKTAGGSVVLLYPASFNDVDDLTTTHGATANLYANWTLGTVKLPTPTRTGYTFGGWYKEAACTNKVGNGGATYTPTAGVTLYAKWTVNKYKLTVDPNGGTWGGSSASQSFTQNYNTTKAIANPTRAGYAFDGWTKSGTGTLSGTTWTFGAGDGTLKAKWAVNTMTLKYHVNGGTITTGTGSDRFRKGSDNLVERSTDSGGTWADVTNNLSITSDAYPNLWNVGSLTIAKTGYHVNGTEAWNTKADGTGISVNQDYSASSTANPATAYRINGNAHLTASKTVTLYANWKANTYSVAYNGNGATSGSMANSAHTYGTAKALTANAYKREYTVTYNYNGSGAASTTAKATSTFNGWATSATGAKAYNNAQSVTNLTTANGATVTLYANWTLGKVTLPTPTRTGYTFGGWYKEAACTNKAGDGGAAFTPTAGVTLYAKWNPISYTVSYNGNGATSGETASSEHSYGVAKNLTKNGFQRAFTVAFDMNGAEEAAPAPVTATSEFDGWAKTASGARAYGDQQSVSNLTTTGGATVALYAKWNQATVTLPTPGERDGYKFAGWYKEAAGANKVGDAGAVVTPTANMTLYAKWNPDNVYTVDYDGNGATSGETASSEHEFGVPKALTRNGYARSYAVDFDENYEGGSLVTGNRVAHRFSGWALSADGDPAFSDGQEVVDLTDVGGGTVQLFACWERGELVLPDAEREGYRIEGWYADEGLSERVGGPGDGFTTDDDTVLYAKWEEVGYKLAVKGVLDGGESDDLSGYASLDVYAGGAAVSEGASAYGGEHPYGSEFEVLATAADGKTIVSAAVEGAMPGTGAVDTAAATAADPSSVTAYGTIGAREATVVLTVTTNRYSVTFDANGGTGETAAMEGVAYGEERPLPVNGFEKAGFAFAGWSLEPGSDVAFADGERVSNLAGKCLDGEEVTLYAKWEVRPYAVSFDPAGGSGNMADLQKTYGERVSVPGCSYTRPGYEFAGWTDQTGSAVAVGETVEVTRDITFTATWNPLQLEFSVLPEIPLEMKANGSLSLEGGADKSLLRNDCGIRLDVVGLRSSDAGRLVLSGDPDGLGEYSMSLSANGDELDMAEYKSTRHQALPNDGWEMQPGETVELDDVTGRVHSMESAFVKREKVAELDWLVSTAQTEVAYEAAGGAGEMTTHEASVGTSFIAPECAYTRDGMEFECWIAQDGTSYAPGDAVEVTEGLVLAANWR